MSEEFFLTLGLRPQVEPAACAHCHKPAVSLDGRLLEARCCTCDLRFDWADMLFVLAWDPGRWRDVVARGTPDPAAPAVDAVRCPEVTGPERRNHPCLYWTPAGCLLPGPARPLMCRTFICNRLRKMQPEAAAFIARTVEANRRLLERSGLAAGLRDLIRGGLDPAEAAGRLMPEYLDFVRDVDRAALQLAGGLFPPPEVRVVVETWGSRLAAGGSGRCGAAEEGRLNRPESGQAKVKDT